MADIQPTHAHSAQQEPVEYRDIPGYPGGVFDNNSPPAEASEVAQ